MTRRTAVMMGLNVKDIRCTGYLGNGHWAGLAGFYSRVCSDTIDFRFRFSSESPSLLSVAHTVSAECATSLSAYFQLRPKVEFPHSVDLYILHHYRHSPVLSTDRWTDRMICFTMGAGRNGMELESISTNKHTVHNLASKYNSIMNNTVE